MVEAVRTTTSTFGIWVIVVVAVVILAVWLVGISVADNIQARESRRWWQRLHGPEAALGGGQEAVVGGIPAQAPPPEPEAVAGRGRHAKPTIDGTGDFRRDAAEADWRTDALIRPDGPTGAAPTGRHALPAQRTGDADQAERSLAGPDAAREDEDPGQA
jgi:hypothetical protein